MEGMMLKIENKFENFATLAGVFQIMLIIFIAYFMLPLCLFWVQLNHRITIIKICSISRDIDIYIIHAYSAGGRRLDWHTVNGKTRNCGCSLNLLKMYTNLFWLSKSITYGVRYLVPVAVNVMLCYAIHSVWCLLMLAFSWNSGKTKRKIFNIPFELVSKRKREGETQWEKCSNNNACCTHQRNHVTEEQIGTEIHAHTQVK